MPVTMPKSEIRSAMYDTFRAVLSPVSVTQRLRIGLSTGWPLLGFFSAAVSSFVPLPSAVAKRGSCEYVFPPVDSSAWMRM